MVKFRSINPLHFQPITKAHFIVPMGQYDQHKPLVPVQPLREKMDLRQEYNVEWVKFQKVLVHPFCKTGFVPKGNSEVFVKNLPQNFDIDHLWNFFRRVGAVLKIRIMMDEEGVHNRGFCYVTYVDSSIADRAIRELNNEVFLEGIYLIIENSLNNCRIFMGGIPTHKTKEEVWQELHRNGIKNIVDVIMYRSYSSRSENRGFVFVEFQTHEQAAHFRAKHVNTLKLWGSNVIIDWSVPIPEVSGSALAQVKILYLRNLQTTQTPQELENVITRFTNRDNVQKVYKFKNYAFIHLKTRELAEKLMDDLKEYFKGTVLEVSWAKPASKFTSPDFRKNQVRNLSKCRSRNNSICSNSPPQEDFNDFERGRFQKFLPSSECAQERINLSIRHRYSSTGSYDFQDSPTSSRPNSNLSGPQSPNYEPIPVTGEDKRNNYFDKSLSVKKQMPSSPFDYYLPSLIGLNQKCASNFDGFNSTPTLLNKTSTQKSSCQKCANANQLSSTQNDEFTKMFDQSRYNTQSNRFFKKDHSLLEPIREYQTRMGSLYGNENEISTRLSNVNLNMPNEDMLDCPLCKIDSKYL